MIVVVGCPVFVALPGGTGSAAGLAADVAAAAAGRGRRVELVGKVGDDGAGDALLGALAAGGIGHAALLRDPARPTPIVVETGPEPGEPNHAGATGERDVAARRIEPLDPDRRPSLEPADIDLALRYLADVNVVVLADPLPEPAIATAVEVATYCGARLVALVPPRGAVPALPPDATVLGAPDEDDGSFAAMVGLFAAGLDAGADPAGAFAAAIGGSGWEAVAD